MLIRTSAALLVVLGAVFTGGPAAAAIAVQAGIGFVAVTGASPGAAMVLDDAHQMQVGQGTVDRLGSLLFRDLAPGSGYVVHETAAGDTPELFSSKAAAPAGTSR